MTALENAMRLEWEAQVAVAEARQLPAGTTAEHDERIERVRLAMELRLVRLAQLRLAEVEEWRAKRKAAAAA
jgi:hypothetical protein